MLICDCITDQLSHASIHLVTGQNNNIKWNQSNRLVWGLDDLLKYLTYVLYNVFALRVIIVVDRDPQVGVAW